MTDETKVDVQEEALATGADPKPEDKKDGTEQDPLKTELEKVNKKVPRYTKRQKLEFRKGEIDKQIQQLDEEEGIASEEEDDDDKPITVGMLKRINKNEATKTALELADDIANETERELVKHHISNTIRPSGNPQTDLANARAIVNDAKNKKVIEELGRKAKPKDHSSGAGSPPANNAEQEEELTPDEQAFMKPPFNLTRSEVLAKRPKFDKK